MSRHALAEPRVQAVVASLTDLFLFHGSVRSVQRLLNEALEPDGREKVYPNRLHSLLSHDQARGVNTATIETLERAIARTHIAASGGERDRLRSAILRAFESEERDKMAPPDGDIYRKVGDGLDVPTGVVARVLAEAQKAVGVEKGRRIESVPSHRADWSFQDDAVERCLRSLAKGPNRKIGLVVPTGGGKTRVAMRVALRMLADSSRDDSQVVWVTHRRRLRTQARRELQRALGDGRLAIPQASPELFEKRVRFVMVNDLAAAVDDPETLELIIVDEAHHAAAPSYQPLFETAPLSGLFLTAKPNRADGLPIGIDDIAYSITYRELFERGVVIEPSFDTPLTIEGLDWASRSHLADLSDYILSRAEEDLRKVLVAVSRTENAESLHDILLAQLDSLPNHPLAPDDIAFVHGGANSSGAATGDFLDEFSARPRGILVATNQLVGEGFDDPLLDGVVITYPSASIGHLMQVAGRAMRWHAEKERVHIVQVRPSSLAYHFEQRWLYQDISDRLRPQLHDVRYSSLYEMRTAVRQILGAHRVDPRVMARIDREVEGVEETARFNLLLTGLPYAGEKEAFQESARWGAVFIGPQNRGEFVGLFNAFSDRAADVANHHDFLIHYEQPNSQQGSHWKSKIDMLAAMEFARKEIERTPYFGADSRPYLPSTGTTWLKYLTFEFHPTIPSMLGEFLYDALNRDAVIAAFQGDEDAWQSAAKIYLPLGGFWAFLLTPQQRQWLSDQRAQLAAMVKEGPPELSFALVRRWRDTQSSAPVPLLLFDQLSQLVSETTFASQLVDIVPFDD